jgi:hypothetical protein
MVFIRKTLQWSVLAIKTWNFSHFLFLLVVETGAGIFHKILTGVLHFAKMTETMRFTEPKPYAFNSKKLRTFGPVKFAGSECVQTMQPDNFTDAHLCGSSRHCLFHFFDLGLQLPDLRVPFKEELGKQLRTLLL